MERITPELAERKPYTWAHHVARYEFARQFCANKVVLDIGCGAGYGAKMLLRGGHAAQLVGLDLHLEETCKIAGLNLVGGDATKLPFMDEIFDVVIAYEVIEHLDAPLTALREIKRVLRTEGVAVISTPRRDLWQKKPANPYHRIEFSISEFWKIVSSTFPVFEMFGQYFDYAFIEIPPPGVGLRRILRCVGSILARLNGSEHLLRRFDVMPVQVAGRHVVPKYMIAVCRKANDVAVKERRG